MNEHNPNCTKLAAVDAQLGTLDAFLDFLGEKGISLGAYHDHTETCGPLEGFVTRECGMVEHRLYPIAPSRTDLLYEFFGIDPKALEAERRALLDGLRR